MKPERIQYDPAQPFSWCDKCHKLNWTRKRGTRWMCASCTLATTKHEAALAAQKAELTAERKAP